MDQRERLEELEMLIEELRLENQGIPIIVEGENDERSLRAVGLNGEILKVNVGQHIFNLCEDWSRRYETLIILTDWDRTGGRLARQIREGLEANGASYDLDLRARLARLSKKEIKDVEGLAGYLERLREQVHQEPWLI